MPIKLRVARLRLPLLLLGSLIVTANVLRAVQASRDLPAYQELVTQLEQDAREPGQQHAALDHARRALVSLQKRHAARWGWTGYMLVSTAGVLVGAGVLGAAFRLRTV